MKDIQYRNPNVMEILEVVRPIADGLLKEGRVTCDASVILAKLRQMRT